MEDSSPHYLPNGNKLKKEAKILAQKPEKRCRQSLMSCFNSVKTEANGNVVIFPAMTDGGDSFHFNIKGGIVPEATGFDNLHPFVKVTFKEEKE